MVPRLLIALELYTIVIGLSIAAFVFLARERLRRLKNDPDVGRTPPPEDKPAIQNPFLRADHSF